MKACVDVGGTKVAVSLADVKALSGDAGTESRLSASRSEPTAKTGTRDALAQQIIRMIGEACAEAGAPESALRGVGVSSCGPFVVNGGLVEVAAPNICGGIAGPARGLPNDWMSATLEAPLRERYGSQVGVRVEIDTIGALHAERRWGALRDTPHCAYVTWSTGVGAALCVDGQVLRGKNRNAGHAGHMFVNDDSEGALCGCGNRGDVEALVAGNAIERRFGRNAAALLEAAKQGESGALAQVDGLCRVMGRMLYNLVIVGDLQRISLGGSVFWHHRDFLLPRLKAQLAGHLPALTDGVELVPAGLKDRVGDYAALALLD
ncbi:ROK family protein [Variovorax sp. VNK109]|uniref:ROK family protein n=1 Tax=Variovorax sp. VNK109 TaxID=3400919 RepID=UPI003C11E984